MVPPVPRTDADRRQLKLLPLALVPAGLVLGAVALQPGGSVASDVVLGTAAVLLIIVAIYLWLFFRRPENLERFAVRAQQDGPTAAVGTAIFGTLGAVFGILLLTIWRDGHDRSGIPNPVKGVVLLGCAVWFVVQAVVRHRRHES